MCLLVNTHYEPAGPLFDIKTSAGEIYELHLPHCETHGKKKQVNEWIPYLYIDTHIIVYRTETSTYQFSFIIIY